MTTYRDTAFEAWGKICAACRNTVGLEVHHIDGTRDNNDRHNLMPLCGTCHNLATSGDISIDAVTREISPNLLGLFDLAPLASQPRNQVQLQLLQLKREAPEIWETSRIPFTLQQDGKSDAYFVECHVPAWRLEELLDFDAILDPRV
jgi:hypothetical protein